MIKLRKSPLASEAFAVDFTGLLDSGDTISAITSVTATPDGLTIANEEINAGVINDTIEIAHAVEFLGSAGTDGYEYTITLVVNTTRGKTITTDVCLLVINTTQLPIDYYGSVLRGTEYFNNRLDNDAWFDSTNPKQRIALFEATQAIDKLNFAGEKTDPDQLLEFPRGLDTEIPRYIEFATYELAYVLLDGVDINREVNKIVVSSESYASVRATYDRAATPDYMIAGIPSVKAWQYLKPYLRDPRHIKFCRVS